MSQGIGPGPTSSGWLEQAAPRGLMQPEAISRRGGRGRQWASIFFALAGCSAILVGVLNFLPGPVATADARPLTSSPTEGADRRASEPREPNIRILAPGVAIERELAAGEMHAYQLTLASGQYLRVMVDPHGTPVAMTLFGPDGNSLVERSTSISLGPTRIIQVTEVSGVYRLEVRSRAKGGPPGRYQIKIEELRAVTAPDHSRVAAERAMMEGNRLSGPASTAESKRRGIATYEAALPLWRAAGDHRGEADTLNSIGRVYFSLGEPQQARDYFQQALPLWQALGNREGEASALNNIGEVYRSLGEPQKARDYFQQALPLWQAVRNRAGEVATFHNIGSVYASLGEPQQALDYLQQALPLWQAVGNREGEASALNNIGEVYRSLGEPQQARDYLQQALRLIRDIGNRDMEAIVLNSIGTVYASLGEPQQARNYLQQALRLSPDIRNRYIEAVTLNNLGQAYDAIGEPQQARDYLQQALRLSRDIGNRYIEAIVLNSIGTVYASLGEPQQARDYFQQALQLKREVGDRNSEAITLYGIARAERDRGYFIEALTQIKAALAIIESLRTKVFSQDLRAAYFASKRIYYEFLIDLLMQLHQRYPSEEYDAAALQASERARARSLLEMLTEAGADIRAGVEPALLERERTLQQQLYAKEQYRMELLSRKYTKEQVAAAEKELNALLTKYQDVQAQIRARNPRYAALTQPQPLSVKEIQQQVLDEDMLLLEYALGEPRSYLWAVTPASIASFELPKRADIETAARRVYKLLTARHRRVRFETTDERRTRIEQADREYPEAARALSQMLLGDVAGQLAGKRLLIVTEGALQYVPFGALPVPEPRRRGGTAATRDPARPLGALAPLVVKHEIVSLPSASVLAVLRRELRERRPAAKTVAVLADPVFEKNDERVRRIEAAKKTDKLSTPSDPGLLAEESLQRSLRDLEVTGAGSGIPRLPFTRQEAEGILALAPEGRGLKALDFAASRATATGKDLGEYRIVHFATHGLLNSQHPELSGLVLSLVDERGQPQNGFLRAHEIYNLHLPVDLVVLSGCTTGLGKEIKAEGLVGLTRGFMYAGAARVVASLWDVHDAATAELMKRFYRGMLSEGRRPAAALRAAQVSLWKEKRWSPPYYWAGFVMQGEWK